MGHVVDRRQILEGIEFRSEDFKAATNCNDVLYTGLRNRESMRKRAEEMLDRMRIKMTFDAAKKIFLNRGYVEVDGGQIFDWNKWREAVAVISEWLEQEPKWIPVTERLPEDGQNVLVCDIDGDIMIGYHVKGRPDTHFTQDGTYEDMKNMKAWMPLPEKYDPDESEVNE